MDRHRVRRKRCVHKDDELVITQPEMSGRGSYLPGDALLNVYPNPVINELNINLKEAA